MGKGLDKAKVGDAATSPTAERIARDQVKQAAEIDGRDNITVIAVTISEAENV
jgi:hypothetical protein